MKRYLSLYRTGEWSLLVEKLRNDIEYNGMTGNSVQLVCLLSQLGCCQLLVSNHYEVDVIYTFLKMEYEQDKISSRERASITRFLAFYSLFEGEVAQAISYYEQSQQYFRMIDAYEEEAMMLTEAYKWLYFLVGHREGMYYALERLKILQKESEELRELCAVVIESTIVSTDMSLKEKFWTRLFYNTSKKMPEESSQLLFVSIPLLFLDLCKAIEQKDMEVVERVAYTLKAQIDQFKHPWFKAFGYFFIWGVLRREGFLRKAEELFSHLDLHDYLTMGEEVEFAQDTLPLFSLPTHIRCMNHKEFVAPISAALPGKLSFSLFDEFTILYSGKVVQVENWKRKKAEEMLIYLLIHPNLQVEKYVLLEEFYPEDDSKKASNRLYVNIHEINSIFRQIIVACEPLVFIEKGKVKMNDNLVEEVDVHSYLKLQSVGNQLWGEDKEAAVELFEKARKRYRKHIVPHFLYASWLDRFREHIKEKQIQLLKKLVSFYTGNEEREELLIELVECDPLHETIVREYVLFLQEHNRYSEAKAIYQKYAHSMKEELGLDVSSDWKSLI